MGVHVITVPDVGEGIAEVELVSWAVSVGEAVARNQILGEVMTEKANVEIPSPMEGVIANLHGEVGQTLAVGSTLIELQVEGAGSTLAPPPAAPVSVAAAPVPAAAPVAAPVTSPAPVARTDRPGAEVFAPRPEGEAPRASPAVRHRARQAGIDLRTLTGSGPAARITHEDLDAVWQRGPTPAVTASTGATNRRPDTTMEERPIIGLRRMIAERMVLATTTIPHITYVEEVDVTALDELRATLNDSRDQHQPRLTILPFLIRAIVGAISDFPQMNAHVDDERDVLTTFGGVHVGVATQTPNGLVVPVIRHAEASSIWSLAARIEELATSARDGRAKAADLSGSTITISSLGALGGLVSTPVINKPEVAVIGVNKIEVRPVWSDNAFVPRRMMNLSSSFDHRIIDGWDAASFIREIKGALEQPALLFMGSE